MKLKVCNQLKTSVNMRVWQTWL